MDFGVSILGNTRHLSNTKDVILLSEHDEIAAAKLFVIGDKAIVVIRLTGFVMVAVYALRDACLVGFFKQKPIPIADPLFRPVSDCTTCSLGHPILHRKERWFCPLAARMRRVFGPAFR